MSRIPHSAKTLIRQVQDHYGRKPESEVGSRTGTPTGEPDGLNVIRTVKFDKTSSKWLKKVLPEIDDPRIVDFRTEDGQVVVQFSHRTDADRRDPFPLTAAETVAGSEEE